MPMLDRVGGHGCESSLPPPQVGVLDTPNTGSRRVKFKTWEELVASGCTTSRPPKHAQPPAAPRCEHDSEGWEEARVVT